MNKQNNCRHANTLVASLLDPIIDNGSLVQMGINETAELNVPGGTLSAGTTIVGLRYIPNNSESTAHGCLCEGWGVANADAATGTFTAYANQSFGGAVNLTVQPGTGSYGVGQLLSESVATSFRSIVTDTADGRVRVIHDYKPSPVTPNLYQVDVTITNISATPIGDLRYRRVMDWDIPPTIFNEFVEIHVGSSANLVAATTDGFRSGDPLSARGPFLVGVPPTTLVSGSPDYFSGPDDQGALFDFTFGTLAPGATKIFTIFYGAGANRQEVLDAIIAVGAEMYSFGFPTDLTTIPPTAAVNGPNAFVFAFKGVGGTPVGPPTRGIKFL